MWQIRFKSGNSFPEMEVNISPSSWSLARIKKFISHNFPEYQCGYQVFHIENGPNGSVKTLIGTDRTRTMRRYKW